MFLQAQLLLPLHSHYIVLVVFTFSYSEARNRTSEGNVRFRGQPCPGGSGPPAITRFKFVTEIFFITQRALHVGLIPAMNAYSSMVSDLAKELQGGNTDERIKILFTVRG